MLPIIEISQTIAGGMAKYRTIFCRDEGFEHVSRYVTGLVMSPNKTLGGIYDLQVWDEGAPSQADEPCTRRCSNRASIDEFAKRDGNDEIHTINANGANLKRLTDTSGDEDFLGGHSF